MRELEAVDRALSASLKDARSGGQNVDHDGGLDHDQGGVKGKGKGKGKCNYIREGLECPATSVDTVTTPIVRIIVNRPHK